MFKRLLRTLTGHRELPVQLVEAAAPALPDAERRLLLRKAKAALAAREFAQVAELVGVLLRANNDDMEALAIEGFRLFELKREDLAVGVLQQALLRGSNDPLVLKFLAMSLSQQGEHLAALAVAEKAHPLLLSDAAFLNTLGWLYLYFNRYEESAEVLNRSLELAPRELAIFVLRNLWTLECCARIHLRRGLLSEKAQQIRKQILRQLLASRKREELSESDALALIVLAYRGPEFFDVARQEADRLFAQGGVEGGTALVMSQLYSMAGDLDRAIKMTELALETNGAGAGYQLGLLRAAAGGKGWLPAWRMQDEAYAQMNSALILQGIPRWQGERLGKKRLLVYQEQGFGDVLMALRFLKTLAARGIHAVFWVYSGMAALIAAADLGMEVLVREKGENEAPESARCDFAVPLFFLITTLKLTPAELKVPVLVKALPARCEAWRSRIESGKGLRVGLIAYGNPWRVDDWYRSVPLQALKPLAQLENVQWVNFSVDVRPELDQLKGMLNMIDPAPDFHDFADTAAVLDVLDLVVAIDCSVAHLAGAMGKPLLVLAPPSIDWRWQVGEDTQPWWPSAQVFRSPAPGRWDEAVAAVAAKLVSISVARV